MNTHRKRSRAMQKSVILWSGLICMTLCSSVWAQLPANPWNAPQTSEGGVAKISNDNSRQYIPSIKYAPINADSSAPVYKAVIDSSVATKSAPEPVMTRQATNTTSGSPTTGTVAKAAAAPVADGDSWRGSGKYGNLNYTGSVTTYGTAYGQEMLAPEVNSHNMKVMLQHLRNLGYKIPESYDTKFQDFLSDYASDLKDAYNGLGHQNNPFDTMFSGFLDVVEDQTELDMENILFNSIDLISKN